jgi:hypothetical protein
MQFLTDTFDASPHDTRSHPAAQTRPPATHLHDAIYAAACYLCDNGAGRGDLHSAIFASNHAEPYRELPGQSPR